MAHWRTNYLLTYEQTDLYIYLNSIVISCVLVNLDKYIHVTVRELLSEGFSICHAEAKHELRNENSKNATNIVNFKILGWATVPSMYSCYTSCPLS